MEIQAGGLTISGAQVFSERAEYAGVSRAALRISLPGAVSDAELSALTGGEMTIDGNSWQGYNTLLRHDVLIAKVVSTEQAEAEAQAARNERDAAQAETQAVRAGFTAALPLISDQPKVVNAVAALLPVWREKAYIVGDVVQLDGVPYRCCQAHDSTGNAGWTPTQAASLWAAYHGTSRDTARAWQAPTGAHDQYRQGEWMIWTDGQAYECVQDTVYDPGSYAAAWRKESGQ